MPCDGSDPLGTGFFPGGRTGFLIRRTSFRVAKSTTANPLKSVSCTKIHFVDPSGLLANAIGRTPRPMSSVHAGDSVAVSNTLTVLPAIDPATTYLPSGVTYGLWMLPVVASVLRLVIDTVSMTSTPPGAWMMPT